MRLGPHGQIRQHRRTNGKDARQEFLLRLKDPKAPYAIAVAEFKDGLKMLGHLGGDTEESEIKIGMKLKIRPVKLEED